MDAWSPLHSKQFYIRLSAAWFSWTFLGRDCASSLGQLSAQSKRDIMALVSSDIPHIWASFVKGAHLVLTLAVWYVWSITLTFSLELPLFTWKSRVYSHSISTLNKIGNLWFFSISWFPPLHKLTFIYRHKEITLKNIFYMNTVNAVHFRPNSQTTHIAFWLKCIKVLKIMFSW